MTVKTKGGGGLCVIMDERGSEREGKDREIVHNKKM